MATTDGVMACWEVLESAGLARPWATPEEATRSAQVWAAVLADVPDGRLASLCVAWLRSSEAKYGRWPLPGALLAALPDQAQVDDADDAWGEALGLIRLLGIDRCPATVAELEDRRARLRAGYREAQAQGDAGRMDRYRRLGAALPRQDDHRIEALLRGVAACGGWRQLGRAEDDAIPAHRASFRAAYRGHRNRRQLSETEQRVAALLDGPSHPRLVDGGQ